MIRATTVSLLLMLASAEAGIDYLRSQDFSLGPQLWAHNYMENSSLSLGDALGCAYCGEIFYHEPPPDDIIFMPPPPMHPSFMGSIGLEGPANKQSDSCNFCSSIIEDERLILDDVQRGSNNRIVALLIAFTTISTVLCLYLIGTKRSKIIASITRTSLFKSNHQPPATGHQSNKTSTLNESIANSGVHLSDPCYLQTNRDKNLTSPIISDHVGHKKTSIPSKYWAQPGSIIGRTIRRIPNEYEVPSSRTNSTGTSSAVYADMNNADANQRFFSPYNLHTYAEVREVLDPNEHFHTSSNSSAMLSESNYDNNVYSHGNCPINGPNIMTTVPNGSVQMSDFNSMRPMQSMAYGPSQVSHHTLSGQPKMHMNSGQPMYEQPPQRAQVIITSNNQGVNPTLLNYKDRIHNVI